MDNKQIEEKLKDGYEQLTPPFTEELRGRVQNEKGQVVVMQEKKAKKSHSKAAMLLAAGVILALGLGGIGNYRANQAVAAVVALEVNPSVEINVNKKERVLNVRPLNDDGAKIIGEMDFSGSTLEVTVNALIGSMLQNGYLNETANSILVSVDDKNSTDGALLQQKLTAEVNELFQNQTFQAAVMSQRLTKNNELAALAKQYNISEGKAQLINEICRAYPGKSFAELTDMSINELNLILCGRNTADNFSVDDNLTVTGKASEQAYIGESKAKEMALAHAQTTADKIYDYECKLDSDDGCLVYEIDFQTNDYDYEYKVHAVNGQIIEHEKEYCGGMQMQHHGMDNMHNMHNAGETYISMEAAKNVALQHAGVSESKITDYAWETDNADGRRVYEIEFKYGGYEYDYEIDAANGAIIKSEKDLDD